MRSHSRWAGSWVSVLASSLLSCGDADESNGPVPVQIEMMVQPGGEALACGDVLTGIGADGAEFTYRGLRLFVSDVRLGRGSDAQSVRIANQDPWQDGRVALLDFEDGRSECAVGTAPVRFTIRGAVDEPVESPGLSFTIGVPFDVNHQDVATASGPLSLTSMFWNWQGGYKFLRLDGSAGGSPYNMHLGSTGCDGGPMGGVTECQNPNRVEVVLDTFALDDSLVTIDLEALFSGASMTNTEETPPGCMSAPQDPECTVIFSNLGLAYGEVPAGDQSTFGVAALESAR